MDDVAARQADDFVIATGKQISVREFVRLSARELGVELDFQGQGIDEIASVASITAILAPALAVGDVIVRLIHVISAQRRLKPC